MGLFKKPRIAVGPETYEEWVSGCDAWEAEHPGYRMIPVIVFLNKLGVAICKRCGAVVMAPDLHNERCLPE